MAYYLNTFKLKFYELLAQRQPNTVSVFWRKCIVYSGDFTEHEDRLFDRV